MATTSQKDGRQIDTPFWWWVKTCLLSTLKHDSNQHTEVGRGKVSVGKIYAGLLILESWRTTRFGKSGCTNLVVSMIFHFLSKCCLSWIESSVRPRKVNQKTLVLKCCLFREWMWNRSRKLQWNNLCLWNTWHLLCFRAAHHDTNGRCDRREIEWEIWWYGSPFVFVFRPVFVTCDSLPCQ